MRNYIILSLMVSCFLIIIGCGGGTDGAVSLPYEGKITLQPSSYTFNFGGSVAPFTDSFNVTIAVFNADGIPLSDVLVWIDFAWATPSPVGVIQLYDGNTPKPAPMNVSTDEDGVYELKIEYTGGCGVSYYGDLQVHSGSVYASPFTLTITGADCGT